MWTLILEALWMIVLILTGCVTPNSLLGVSVVAFCRSWCIQPFSFKLRYEMRQVSLLPTLSSQTSWCYIFIQWCWFFMQVMSIQCVQPISMFWRYDEHRIFLATVQWETACWKCWITFFSFIQFTSQSGETYANTRFACEQLSFIRWLLSSVFWKMLQVVYRIIVNKWAKSN